jgi:hypothetical protein
MGNIPGANYLLNFVPVYIGKIIYKYYTMLYLALPACSRLTGCTVCVHSCTMVVGGSDWIQTIGN